MKRILKHACSRRSLQATSALAGLMFALSAGSALADPIALVLDKSEGVDVSAFTELMPGDVVDLGATGHVDLLDYSACQEVRIQAGVLKVSSEGYTAEGSEQKVLRAGNCLQADSGTDSEKADKGLTVTLRGLTLENKKAASLMLRFDNKLRDQYDTVFVSFGGGEPKRFDMLDNILTDMPNREPEDEAVEVELFLQGKAPDYGVVMRTITIDPVQVGRKTAVVIVK
ncbi:MULTISPECIES: hypothetical protein [Stappiaceae]|jgi:hypothetical protein|uniref:Uncharacterized protein n=1 Tax=Roseibium aggregatum TaxID=187304 RepID=A0A0M6XYF4_9HYPH|nr:MULTISPECIES: hypothetical protein [Stappiaceae]MCR9282244.1 hypothetical protein [Paracoccaceae bacterium]MEE2865035.1 hypothetical protein [Pseudomonadota bacterium]MBO9458859.1 hypothetical protein [Labrenzia sp. R5_0]QFT69457.1 hypothetical protein FIU93_21920 [Labrenzia sp. THAF35]WJS00792.1 hypothetical protein QUB73_16635 [Roseibium aggregatum]